MATCRKCSHFYPDARKIWGKVDTCIDCGSPPLNLPIIEVNKSNPVVGTLAELASASAKGPRTW